jgi:ComF family protein
MPAGPVLGQLLTEAIRHLNLADDCDAVLVPVPLHSSKRRERGFNQSELVARYALKQMASGMEFAPVLKRHRATHSQVGLTREERIANMRDAFRVIDPASVKGRTVIVVDDVMTTGTTVSECARVLKKAGAERVFAATVARTLKGAQLSTTAQSQEEEDETAHAVSV